ncbi:MAG: hypothetical protein R6W31_16080 [Bacteroidales bacterium]
MNRLFIPLPALIILLICSCEEIPEATEKVCLPTNMTATVIMGSNTMKLIADFYYLPDSDLLDHITWSDHQTHFFEYDASNRLMVVRKLKVKEKVQEELWFIDDGDRVSEVILVKRNLDYTYLEPLDSIFTGRIVYEYEGKNVIGETEYGVLKGSNKEYPVREAGYEYDGAGNISSSTTIFPDGSQPDVTVSMTYDTGKHPFSGLNYYFTGESFVNNQLTRVEGTMDYSYNATLNTLDYPEAIYEKLGSSNSRIFRYTYMIR